ILRLEGERAVDVAPGPRVLLTAVAGGWAVGADGPILHAAAPVPSGERGLLTGVAVAPDGGVFVVGAAGQILHAPPGGAFAPEPSGTTAALRAVTTAGAIRAAGAGGL